ncbi:adenylate cyclase [Natronocella acetinitrilica]|uniref:Adenylate cyclase n=1 Tax=Natronocella acetinitrilica TaxID=414046 RepID=A0AAE3G4B6_9GAMM|nr:CYTH domain-containing protein [Natronocella acetinitrilica]MCP1674933.1 adenylate cyclase [Natronocella acetinitrilica]
MGIEVERKFLVVTEQWRAGAERTLFRQGYLSTDRERTVRVRLAGDAAWLTIKGVTEGVSRREFEYAVPPADAEILLDELCLRPLIEKYRYRVQHAGLTWEVDEFLGDNAGLIIAEVELDHPDQAIELPSWVGKEVSDDARYFNANLIAHPYCRWR